MMTHKKNIHTEKFTFAGDSLLELVTLEIRITGSKTSNFICGYEKKSLNFKQCNVKYEHDGV